jgi:periplasmic mercuric ion binding protein
MKFLQLSFIAIIAMVSTTYAQQKTTDKAVIKIPTAQCDMCKAKIEKALFKQDGIMSYKVDVKKKTVNVSWITDRTNIENIKTMIANAGYDADDVAADETAYKKLPGCCKKPAAAAVN